MLLGSLIFQQCIIFHKNDHPKGFTLNSNYSCEINIEEKKYKECKMEMQSSSKVYFSTVLD